MSELPFDKLEIPPPFTQVFNEVQEKISRHTEMFAKQQWGLHRLEWSDLAWKDPGWAMDQTIRAKDAAQIAKEAAQVHVVSCFQSTPPHKGEDMIVWRQETYKALSQALELASKCIQEVHNLGDQEINKTRILQEISSSAPSRGGFER